MNCVCHDEAMYWNKDARTTAGGYWRCAVEKRAHSRRVDQARRDVKLERQRAEHHSPDGGWLRRRRRDLRNDRARITERLQQLEREAAEC